MGKVTDEVLESWLREKVMVDEWGRPPSLADVPLTIMTRKEAFFKQNITDMSFIKEVYVGYVEKKKGESDD